VATKWFIIGFFPIFPLGSVRLRDEDTSGIPFFGRTSSFELIEEAPLDWLQVMKTWAYAVLIIAWVGYLVMSELPGAFKLAGLIGGVALPHVLRWFAKSRAGVA
jgi:hypothetical protein